MFVGILFFRLIAYPGLNNSNETTIGNGLAQLQKNRGGRACLFILGFFLIVYGLFAVRDSFCAFLELETVRYTLATCLLVGLNDPIDLTFAAGTVFMGVRTKYAASLQLKQTSCLAFTSLGL